MNQMFVSAADADDIGDIISARRAADASFYFDAEAAVSRDKTILAEELANPKGAAVYAVREPNGDLVAACALYDTFQRNGYTHLRFDFYNKKIDERFEAVRLISEFCFETLNFHKINVELLQSQQEELRLFLQAGFSAEIRMEEHFYRHGVYEDVYRLGLTKTDFLTGTPAENTVTVDFEATPVPSRDHQLLPEVNPGQNLLTGKKINLTHFEQQDFEELYAQEKGSDQQFFASLGAAGPISTRSSEAFVGHKNDYLFISDMLMFSIRKKDGALVGYINLTEPDLRSRHVTMGLVIMKPENRSSGYGSEAIRLITDFAFLELNMHRVYLGAFSFNEGAAGLYEHLGFQPEGRNRAFVYRGGRYYDELMFGVTRESWLKQRGYL